MNLRTLEQTRLEVEDSYRQRLLEQWELDLRAKAKLNPGKRTIEVNCVRLHDERIPLGEPLIYTFSEARNFGSTELERLLEHVKLIININKLI